MLNLNNAIDFIAEYSDADPRIEKIFLDFYQYPEDMRKTQRIIDYFTPQALEDPDDEPPRKKLKGISLDDIGLTLLHVGWAIGFIQGKQDT